MAVCIIFVEMAA